jgi:hypothetical protein
VGPKSEPEFKVRRRGVFARLMIAAPHTPAYCRRGIEEVEFHRVCATEGSICMHKSNIGDMEPEQRVTRGAARQLGLLGAKEFSAAIAAIKRGVAVSW